MNDSDIRNSTIYKDIWRDYIKPLEKQITFNISLNYEMCMDDQFSKIQSHMYHFAWVDQREK